MNIVKEWLEDFVELRLSADELRAKLEDAAVPIREIQYGDEGFSNVAHLGPQQYVLKTENDITLSYAELGRLLSLQSGFPYLEMNPVTTGPDIPLSDPCLKILKNVLYNTDAVCALLIKARTPNVPEWLARRLSMAGICFITFAEAVCHYVNAEIGSDIYMKNGKDDRVDMPADCYLYCCAQKSDINDKGLRRIRQIWEQHVPTCGFRADREVEN